MIIGWLVQHAWRIREKDVEFLVRNLRERWANMWNSYAVLGKTYFRGTRSNLLQKYEIT
jgi:hypothetical protein